MYGKAEGAGTGVTLGNTHYAGLGIPIPFDEDTGVCGAVSIRGLTANESYVRHLMTWVKLVPGRVYKEGFCQRSTVGRWRQLEWSALERVSTKRVMPRFLR